MKIYAFLISPKRLSFHGQSEDFRGHLVAGPDLNRRPTAYEAAELPLLYPAVLVGEV